MLCKAKKSQGLAKVNGKGRERMLSPKDKQLQPHFFSWKTDHMACSMLSDYMAYSIYLGIFSHLILTNTLKNKSSSTFLDEKVVSLFK